MKEIFGCYHVLLNVQPTDERTVSGSPDSHARHRRFPVTLLSHPIQGNDSGDAKVRGFSDFFPQRTTGAFFQSY